MTTESESVAEAHEFQAEVSQLLHLMVHSVYAETDVFLRELISNASDACDKLRYEAISKPELLADGAPLMIRVKPDATLNTLTIADNGIGMSRQELIDNLGTVARSGTRAFVSRLAENREAGGLIGQFGVGFYSAFMVADRIEVISRSAGSSDVWVWRSSGGAGFEVSPATQEEIARVPRGTEIVLHLKEDAKRFLETYNVHRIIKTYSNHIQFPIEHVGADGVAQQINSASAPWQRPKSELTAEDHKQAYQALSGFHDDPALTIHYKAEGRQSYAVLLFAPSSRPFDFNDPDRRGRVRLYVRRVYITDDAQLLPPYLRFIRGAVDSEDMPLNISREMLQNNPQVAQIRNALTGRVLTELETLAEKDQQAFAKIWDAFGKIIKEGLYDDHQRHGQILALSRFTTTKGEGPRSLAQYVSDLKTNQTEIYYLTGATIEHLQSNPKLEAARARGIEVLLLTDPVDALWTSLPHEHAGKKLKSLSQGEIDFNSVPLLDTTPAHDDGSKSPATVEGTTVIAAVKNILGDRVSDVRTSQRLTESPACLVAAAAGQDRELQRLLARESQGFGPKPVLELNMKHPLVRALSNALADKRDDDVADISSLLFDQGKILDGEVPDDPAGFAARLNRLIVRGLPM